MTTDNAFKRLDDLASEYCARGKNTVEKLSDDDINNLLINFIQATETKYLPSYDLIDPNKSLIYAIVDYLMMPNLDIFDCIIGLMRDGLLDIYRVRINNLLAEKQKEHEKPTNNL